MPIYRVTDKTTGIEWGAGESKRRVESGETADDIPAEAVSTLIASGLIEEVKAVAADIPDDDRTTGPLDE